MKYLVYSGHWAGGSPSGVEVLESHGVVLREDEHGKWAYIDAAKLEKIVNGEYNVMFLRRGDIKLIAFDNRNFGQR